MTATQEIGYGELERLEAFTIRRPTPVRDRWGRWRRDPGGEWDWFYALPADEQVYIRANHMSEYGTMPDELADWLGCEIDAAMDQWTEALRLTRRQRVEILDPLSDEWASCYDDDVERWVGPDEVADLLHVKRNTINQWRHRGLLPEPKRVLSGLPIWDTQAILDWARETNRAVVTP